MVRTDQHGSIMNVRYLIVEKYFQAMGKSLTFTDAVNRVQQWQKQQRLLSDVGGGGDEIVKRRSMIVKEYLNEKEQKILDPLSGDKM
jgi:hypothetical protein